MPPEVKPVISSLAEMTCENCVYSAHADRVRLLSIDVKTGQPVDKIEKKRVCRNIGDNVVADNYFCSKGKWMTATPDYDEADVTNFDLCYELFKDTK